MSSPPSAQSPEFEGWVNSLSMKALKAFIKERGLDFSDCLEKSEFRARATEAAKQGGGGGGSANSSSKALVKKRRKFAGYDCEVHAPASVHSGDQAADFVVVFLHGYGASAENVSSIVGKAKGYANLEGKTVCWVFPQAHKIGGTAAWWKIDVMEWMQAAGGDMSGIAQMIRREFDQLPECRQSLQTLVKEVLQFTKATHSKLLLGGFSQGAMTAIDCALTLPKEQACAGILCVSGAPIVVDQWAEKCKAHAGLRVLMTHGKNDQVLFYQGSIWLKDLLTQGELKVQHESHMEQHSFGDERILMKFVDEIAGGV